MRNLEHKVFILKDPSFFVILLSMLFLENDFQKHADRKDPAPGFYGASGLTGMHPADGGPAGRKRSRHEPHQESLQGVFEICANQLKKKECAVPP